MILSTPSREDFVFDNDARVDVDNRGFTPEEMQKLAGSEQARFRATGEKGLAEWWERLWPPSRKPEINDLKSEFGYQSKLVLTDLIAVANAQGTPLEGIIQARSQKYNFFIMPCGVYILPQEGETFKALKFEIYYGDESASTYEMLPGPQTEKILEAGGKVEVGFTGKGEFGLPQIPLFSGPVGASVGAGAKAEVETKFIVSFHYELKTQVVDAFGRSNPFCRWMMWKGEHLRNDVVFYPVIMTPKEVTSFPCEIRAYFKIDHPDWKNAEFFLKPPLNIDVST